MAQDRYNRADRNENRSRESGGMSNADRPQYRELGSGRQDRWSSSARNSDQGYYSDADRDRDVEYGRDTRDRDFSRSQDYGARNSDRDYTNRAEQDHNREYYGSASNRYQDYGHRDTYSRDRFQGRFASGADYSYGRHNDYNDLGGSRGVNSRSSAYNFPQASSETPRSSQWGRSGSSSSYGSNQEWSPQGSDYQTQSYAGRGPKGYKRSDERIKEDVSEALARHSEIDASDIEVAVKDGEVTLTGTVNERGMKRMAEEAAEDCSGVRDVINQIRVKQEGRSESLSETSRAGSSSQNMSSSKKGSSSSTSLS